MNADLLAETVALLTALAHKAEDLAATLPALEMPAADLAGIAGELEHIQARFNRVENRVEALGPVEAPTILPLFPETVGG